MDDFVLLLILGGFLLVSVMVHIWLARRLHLKAASALGVQARQDIEDEQILLFADVRKVWAELKPEEKKIMPFLEKHGIDIALKYPKATRAIMRDGRKFLKWISELGIDL